MKVRSIQFSASGRIHRSGAGFWTDALRTAGVAAVSLAVLTGCSDLLSNALWDSGRSLETSEARMITFSAGTDISTTANSAESVYAADLDGDGDADVLSASSADDRIVWYENTDGNGTFSAGTDISNTADGAYSVYATDLDGDGDADVLSASIRDNRIVWYENRLNQVEGDFSSGTNISTTVDQAWSVYATDLDGDGDADVLAAALADNRIFWYENRLDQVEADFSAGTDIPTTASRPRSVYATDLDGDGDADVLSASSVDDRIVWYENTDGDGTFSAGTDISTTADFAQAVYATDLDGDGDADVLSASSVDDRIVWYENTDGSGAFSSGTDISTTANFALSVYAIDLNGDGHPDVLSASRFDDRIVWYENVTVVP
jgi:hypothetical protein